MENSTALVKEEIIMTLAYEFRCYSCSGTLIAPAIEKQTVEKNRDEAWSYARAFGWGKLENMGNIFGTGTIYLCPKCTGRIILKPKDSK